MISLNKHLARRIKAALTSGRKESPVEMPFDHVEFHGGLKTLGTKKRVVRGIQHYKIKKYEDLYSILGADWHWRGINSSGDFNYIVLDTVEYYLYHKRPIKEYIPSSNSQPQQYYDMGDALVFTFVKGSGTPANFGTDKTIFV